MAIVNRDNDVSQQKVEFSQRLAATTTAATYLLWQAPYPCEVRNLTQAACGVSGAPFNYIDIYRWNAAGPTTITGVHASLAVVIVGTSGAQGFSVLAPGNSLVQMQRGDYLVLRTAVANTCCTELIVSGVVKKLQDVVSYYGQSS